MKKILLFLTATCLFASCATIINSEYCDTNIKADFPATAIINSDTIALTGEDDGQTIRQKRSKEQKIITVIKDTSTYTVFLRPYVSPDYLCNIFSGGIGFIIDGNTPKIWQYPIRFSLPDHYIEPVDPDKYSHKGVMNIRFSLPFVNWFYSSYEGRGTMSHAGFMGISLGLDYYYRDKTFINISGAGIMDFFIPFPAAVDFGGMVDNMSSLYGYVSNNHRIGRFAVGYGISYGYDEWNTINHGWWAENTDPALVNQPSIYRNSTSLGLVFPIHYYTYKGFYAGVIYRPMLLQFADKTRFRYQHTASIDIGYMLRLKK